MPQAGAGLRLGGSNTGDNYWRGTLNDINSIPVILSKIDAGTWIVTGNSGYTGGTTIGSGTLGFGRTTALGTGTVAFSGNATLRAAVTGTLSNIMSTGASSAVTATLDTTAAGLVVGASQTLGGSGTVAGGFTIAGGATLSPGNSPGTLAVTGSTLWGGDGNYNWQMYATAGGTAAGWDFVDSTGSLTITASGSNPFNINMWSLSGLPDTTGNVSDFDPGSSFNFLIAEFDGGITGWDPAKFNLNTSPFNGTGGFTNDITGQGTFTLARGDTVLGGNANQIWIVYAAAVPEPGTLGLAGIGVAAAGLFTRRRRRCVTLTGPRRGT